MDLSLPRVLPTFSIENVIFSLGLDWGISLRKKDLVVVFFELFSFSLSLSIVRETGKRDKNRKTTTKITTRWLLFKEKILFFLNREMIHIRSMWSSFLSLYHWRGKKVNENQGWWKYHLSLLTFIKKKQI